MFFKILLFLIFSAFACLSAQVAIEPSAGEGTEDNPFQIVNLQNLYWIAEDTSRYDYHYIQVANIFAYSTVHWYDGKGWSPIGKWYNDSEHYPFTGSYDGQGNKIEGLYLSRTSESSGLFGFIENAVIKNLTLTEIQVLGINNVGGLSGYSEHSSIINCFVSGSVNGISHVGLISGKNNFTSLFDSHVSGSVQGTELIGGLVGNFKNSTIRNSFYNYDELLINDSQLLSIGGIDNTTFNQWIDNDYILNINDYLLTDGENYLIQNFDNISMLKFFGQFPEHSYLLTEDIDLTPNQGFFIPYFTGSFNGNEFTISNLKVNQSFNAKIGLFGIAFNSVIENLNIIDSELLARYKVGGLAGSLIASTVTNCHSSGSSTGQGYVGGLIGYGSQSNISYCSNLGNVSGTYFSGGLVGSLANDSLICTSFNSGNISGSFWVGGLVGCTWSSNVKNCYNTGNIHAYIIFVGGLVGYNTWHSKIENSYSIGFVSGLHETGGLVGMSNMSATVEKSYWDTRTSNQDNSSGGEGRTTDEMTFPYANNTYVDWDFVEIWSADTDHTHNNGYPFLQEIEVSTEGSFISNYTSPNVMNYPNPFNPETNIVFYLEEAGDVTIDIYNVKGQRIRTLNNFFPNKGKLTITWDGKNDEGKSSGSGVYFYRIETPSFTAVRKMMMLK